MNNKLKIASAFAGGAVAGAIAGIMLAPDKGSSTRNKMIAKMKKAKAINDEGIIKKQKPIKWKIDENSTTSGNE